MAAASAFCILSAAVQAVTVVINCSPSSQWFVITPGVKYLIACADYAKGSSPTHTVLFSHGARTKLSLSMGKVTYGESGRAQRDGNGADRDPAMAARCAEGSFLRPLLDSAGLMRSGGRRAEWWSRLKRSQSRNKAAVAAMAPDIVGEDGFRLIIWAASISIILGHKYRPIALVRRASRPPLGPTNPQR
jgi:hypothetical protein